MCLPLGEREPGEGERRPQEGGQAADGGGQAPVVGAEQPRAAVHRPEPPDPRAAVLHAAPQQLPPPAHPRTTLPALTCGATDKTTDLTRKRGREREKRLIADVSVQCLFESDAGMTGLPNDDTQTVTCSVENYLFFASAASLSFFFFFAVF